MKNLAKVIQTLKLNQIEAKKIMTIGKELWFQYLESRLLIFGRGASVLNRFRRDKEMTKSIRSDGFS